jgi:hypothetical protein
MVFFPWQINCSVAHYLGLRPAMVLLLGIAYHLCRRERLSRWA